MENTRELIRKTSEEETPEIEHPDTNDIGFRVNENDDVTPNRFSCSMEMTVPLSETSSGASYP